jgi:hypothetical protein
MDTLVAQDLHGAHAREHVPVRAALAAGEVDRPAAAGGRRARQDGRDERKRGPGAEQPCVAVGRRPKTFIMHISCAVSHAANYRGYESERGRADYQTNST